MPKARLFFDGDNSGIEKEARTYSLTQEVEDKLDSISNLQDEIDGLQDQINNLASRGRYLSTWDCVTGLPGTDPQVDPYVYRAGDYYIVSNVGGTNLRPAGAEYHVQVPSQVVESQSVSQNDLYIYDGIQWVLQGSGSSLLAVWGSITGTLSAQTDLQNALDDKQDELTAGEGISIDANNVISNTLPGVIVDSTAPSNPAQGDLWYDTTNNKLKTFDGTNWNETGVTYVAGDNIQINGTTISATDTKYSAGRNVTIGGNVINARDTEYEAGSNITIACPTESDMKGPAPSGFHVPLKSEWEAICNIIGNVLGLSVGKATFETYLLMPTAGILFSNLYFSDFYFGYWTSTRADDGKARFLDEHRVTTGGYPQISNAYAIRALKNTPVVPDNTWTTLYDGSSVATNAGIFYNSIDGLISISGDGTTWYTIQDKNLGATVVYHSGDALSDANCGALYQWGNNYAFSRSNTPSKQNPTAISASGYGPGNYYTSDTYGTSRPTRDNSGNKNLRGGVTQGTWQDCEHPIISATGGATYTAGSGINIDQNNEISVDTTVVATQTDLNTKQDTLTAGENIQIDTTTNTISATDTTYNAGENITIGDGYITENDMKGPCPSGYHIPTKNECDNLLTTFDAFNMSNSVKMFITYFKLTKTSYRNYFNGNAPSSLVEQQGDFWTCTKADSAHAYTLLFEDLIDRFKLTSKMVTAAGCHIRPFKDTPAIPDNTWTTLYDGSSTAVGAGIFHNASEGLISISSDGTNWITIADKNLGATQVCNYGDSFTQENSGNYYQWGNNYEFPFRGTITTSGTKVDTSSYGPGNYYNSSTFITTAGWSDDWSSVDNTNLWGGVTQGTYQEYAHNVISATDTTYTAGTGLSLSNGEFSVDTTTIATKADIANLGTFVVVDTLPTAASADEKTIYLLGPIGTGADKYEEWIITRGAGNWASTTTMYPFTVNKNAWDGAIFIDSQTSPLSDFHGDCYVGAKLTSIGDETKLPVKLSFRAGSSVDSEWVGLNEPAFAYNPDQYPNGDDLDIYIPNTSSSNSVSITAEGVMSSSPITWELGPKQWTKIGETSIDLSGYATTSALNSGLAAKQDTLTASTGINIDSSNNISNTLPGPTIASTAPTGTEGALWYDTTNDVLMAHDGTARKEAGTQMKVLSYGHSTWQDFLDAYNENAIVYCKASSQSNPGSGNQGRMAFMAFVDINATTGVIQGVEFQYYRSRNAHSTAATVLDEVYIYKLTSNGTWTVTQRDTAAKPIAGTGIGLTYNASGMTISADTTTLATKTDLNSKQDTLVSGTNIKTINNESLLGSGNITISAPTYTAGDNVQISSSNVISATDTKYNAGEGISIGNVTRNGRQGPSPKGFHVPSTTEWQGVKAIMDGLSLTDGADWKVNLHMPYAGVRVFDDAAINFQRNGGYYRTSTPRNTSAGKRLTIVSGNVGADSYDWRSNANSIRSFKDLYETPDSTWTVVQGTLGSAGIFWNQSEGLISITDGTTGYTIMDKNLGATTVYNNGETLTQANMGNLYQWGNNYGFPSTGTIANTSSTQVDASSYGPTNPYSSDTFITGSNDWSSVQNDDLWGDTTGTYTQENVISNTVINSIQSSGPINVKKIWAGTTAQYNALSTYDADTIYIKVD